MQQGRHVPDLPGFPLQRKSGVFGRFPALLGWVAGRLHWGQPSGSLSGYSVLVVCLSMMICSTALAV